MTDPNRLNYQVDQDESRYCSASEGRDEEGTYVPDIWHAVELLASGPAATAACGAHYDGDKLSVDLAFVSRPESQKCGGCLSRVGSPMAFVRS